MSSNGTPLSPAKLCPGHYPGLGGSWYRLARLDDGHLVLESISDRTLNRPGPEASWAWCGDLTSNLERQLTDDNNPDLVARVLNAAIDQIIRGAQ